MIQKIYSFLALNRFTKLRQDDVEQTCLALDKKYYIYLSVQGICLFGFYAFEQMIFAENKILSPLMMLYGAFLLFFHSWIPLIPKLSTRLIFHFGILSVTSLLASFIYGLYTIPLLGLSLYAPHFAYKQFYENPFFKRWQLLAFIISSFLIVLLMAFLHPNLQSKSQDVLTIFLMLYLQKIFQEQLLDFKTFFLEKNTYQQQITQWQESSLALSRTKNTLLKQLSHELRTPLNAIIGFSDMLQQKEMTHPIATYQEYSEHIHKSGLDLLEIIEKMLQMAELETGKINVTLGRFRATMPLFDLKQNLFDLAMKKHIHIEFKNHLRDDYMITSDKTLMTDILKHLLHNAIKFSPAHSQIILSISETPTCDMIYMIKDSGKGFSKIILNNFGLPFNVDINPLQENQAKTGLGLAITKKMAELLGGNLQIYNAKSLNPQDKGAVTCLTIPIHYSKQQKTS